MLSPVEAGVYCNSGGNEPSTVCILDPPRAGATRPVIIHVVSNNPGPLVAWLRGAGFSNPCVDVRATTSMPIVKEGQEQSVVVIDISNAAQSVRPPHSSNGPTMLCVLIVDRQQSVPFPWLEFAASCPVRVVGIQRDSPDPFAPLLSALELINRRRSTGQLAELLVDRHPSLRRAEDIVQVILGQPWRIRRPSDLAFCSHVSESTLRDRCHELGLKRIEHLITLVRWLAFELLVSAEGMPPKRARIVVGITDRANFRRQLGRLSYLDVAPKTAS